MELRAYREMKGWTLAELAEKIGAANANVVHRYETGYRMPRPRAVEKIEDLTEGEVRFRDLYATHKAFKEKANAA